MSDKKCLGKGETPKAPKPEHKYQCARCGATAKKESRLCKPKHLKVTHHQG
ncbi:hypothetical protein LX69_02303 [Breznakibacter xylanolyticus]|uniref:Uncharacterized protein n=1 Tax=Breznakibacter xylanolyticus TaxID=990 RepID=A0A2W7N5H5_9BACT|nr:hypothetical protein [Breznakibacter xylanolyticus]MBN2742600.1 hypothetical protein [Marinilabiliaceae bacterium]PZX14973.1 hypothetical protein LX69_02303 [Breznakibacter xylanolyticus]